MTSSISRFDKNATTSSVKPCWTSCSVCVFSDDVFDVMVLWAHEGDSESRRIYVTTPYSVRQFGPCLFEHVESTLHWGTILGHIVTPFRVPDPFIKNMIVGY
ncbi:hypothetical protein AYI69_g9688 [Smittium culicis]|uniref:Uncharacterized protein n=1 Tax=Smittium culicis TaxID=133412 RepID=A0A1R1XB16_9FUNG|nr:hypothetical protein AYI69_g9688 [Smittium culicis]